MLSVGVGQEEGLVLAPDNGELPEGRHVLFSSGKDFSSEVVQEMTQLARPTPPSQAASFQASDVICLLPFRAPSKGGHCHGGGGALPALLDLL